MSNQEPTTEILQLGEIAAENSRPSIEDRLAEPFDPRELKLKPQVVNGNRALAVIYVDARVVQDRLDRVFGVDGWQDDYEILADGNVLCRLRVKIDGAWITKTDVGGPSAQPDGGDRLKAATSDALKRAAVKLSIGRYIYRLGGQWLDFDPKKKQFSKTPSLPPDALPYGYQPPRRNAKPALPASSAPAALTPATIETDVAHEPAVRWKNLMLAVSRYAEMLKENPRDVHNSLFKKCRVAPAAKPANISAEQWHCLETTIHEAIAKRAGATPALAPDRVADGYEG
jgi:hypothetical protein